MSELEGVRGRTIELPAEFFSGAAPIDPVNPRVSIIEPSGIRRLVRDIPDRVERGYYIYPFPIPGDAPTGTWRVEWTAEIDGSRVSGVDPFTVIDAERPSTPVIADSGPLDRGAEPRSQGPEADPTGEDPPHRDIEVFSLSGPTTSDIAPPAGEEASAETEISGDGPPRERRRRKRRRSGEDAQDGVPVEEEGRAAAAALPGSAERRRPLILLVLLLGAAVAVLSYLQWRNRPPDLTEVFLQGAEAMAEGDIIAARSFYLDALQQDPQSEVALFNLGLVAQQTGDLAGAEDLYRRALQANRSYLPPAYNLALLYQTSGRFEDAAALYGQVLQEHPDHVPSHFYLGSILVQRLGEPEEGQQHLDRALELDPALADRLGGPAPEPEESPPPPTPEPTIADEQ